VGNTGCFSWNVITGTGDSDIRGLLGWISAAITPVEVIKKILRHLKLAAEPSQVIGSHRSGKHGRLLCGQYKACHDVTHYRRCADGMDGRCSDTQLVRVISRSLL